MIDYDLKKIRALLFDVDGVLSCETITMNDDGIPMRTVNIKDGYALQLAVKLGLNIAIITGGNSETILKRYRGLGVKEIFLNSAIKIEAYRALLEKWQLAPEEVLFMGDDIPDYEVMKACGCPCCPLDAAPEIKEISRYISRQCGGRGCVRDVIEQVLRAQGKWNMDKTAFGW